MKAQRNTVIETGKLVFQQVTILITRSNISLRQCSRMIIPDLSSSVTRCGTSPRRYTTKRGAYIMSGKINQHLIEQGVSTILRGLGVDLSDHNYIETPERVARMYLEMF